MNPMSGCGKTVALSPDCTTSRCTNGARSSEAVQLITERRWIESEVGPKVERVRKRAT
jgi:hypothetical protein